MLNAILLALATLAAFSSNSVTVEWIEVTQAIQDTTNSVTLIAGKRTVARVYLSSESSANVKGWLRIKGEHIDTLVRSEEYLLLDPSMNASVDGNGWRKRTELEASLNFVLPPCDGRVTLSLDSIADNTSSYQILGQRRTTSVTFVPVAPLEICLIGLPYVIDDSTVLLPRAVDYRLIRSWIRRAFPAGDIRFRQIVDDTTDKATVLGGPDGCWAWAAVEQYRRLDHSHGAGLSTHYYGVVFDDGSHFTRGYTLGAPSDSGGPAAGFGPAGDPRGAYDWDRDSTYGDWYAGHELGHSFGRLHIGVGPDNAREDAGYPYPGGYLTDSVETFAGFDVGDPIDSPELPMAPIRPLLAHDVMSYSNEIWVSDYTYLAMLERLQHQVPAAPASVVPPSVATGVPRGHDSLFVAHVIGLVDTTHGTGLIQFVSHQLRSAAVAADTSGRAVLGVLDSSGRVLYTRSVEQSANDCRSGDCPELLMFSASVPDLPGIAAIELRYDGRVLDTWSVPRFSAITDTAASVESDGNYIRVRWPGIVPPSGVQIRVELSRDLGRTWHLERIGNDTPQITLLRQDYLNVPRVSLRIAADAGVESVQLSTTVIDLER